jgi:hypothetical protein
MTGGGRNVEDASESAAEIDTYKGSGAPGQDDIERLLLQTLICTCEDLIKSMLLSREEGRNGPDSRTLCTLNHNLQPHQRIFVPRNLRLVLNPEGSIGHCVSASAFSLPLPLSLKAS